MIKLVGKNLRQYDLNRQVEIIPAGTVLGVHFLNRSPNPFEVAFTEENGRVYADIPSVLLKTFGVVTVETVEMLDDGSQIEQRQTFNVDRAEKPEGYVCPKPEILTPNWLKNNSTGELPFGETTVMGDTLTWDGNTEGLVGLDLMGTGVPSHFCVTDTTPTLEELQQGGTIGTPDGPVSFGSDAISEAMENIYMVAPNNDVPLVVIALEDTVVPDASLTINKGVYFFFSNGMGVSSFTINNYTFTETKIKTIDPKYLPFGGVKIANFTAEADGTTTGNTTFEQIKTMLSNGAYVVASVNALVAGAIYYVPVMEVKESEITFTIPISTSANVVLTITSDNDISFRITQ